MRPFRIDQARLTRSGRPVGPSSPGHPFRLVRSLGQLVRSDRGIDRARLTGSGRPGRPVSSPGRVGPVTRSPVQVGPVTPVNRVRSPGQFVRSGRPGRPFRSVRSACPFARSGRVGPFARQFVRSVRSVRPVTQSVGLAGQVSPSGLTA